MQNDITPLIAKIEHSRVRLNLALEKVAPQVEVYPSWKIKQVLDHITGWDELVYDSLEAYRRGEQPPMMREKDFDQYNASSVSRRSALSIEQSRQAYDLARQKVLKTLSDLPGDMLTREYPAPWRGKCTIPSIIKIFVSHELEHARQIEKTLKEQPAAG